MRISGRTEEILTMALVLFVLGFVPFVVIFMWASVMPLWFKLCGTIVIIFALAETPWNEIFWHMRRG